MKAAAAACARRFLTAASLSLACAGVAPAQPCDSIQAAPVARVGEVVRFTLRCAAADMPRVAWEFGDTSARTEYADSRTASHAYSEPGVYTVFARFQGEDIPLSHSVAVIRPPTAAAPTHSTTLVHDPKRGRIFAVNPDHHTVASLKVSGYSREYEAAVGRNPRTLALDAEGNLWVVCQDDAALHILRASDGARLAALALPFGSRPYGIAFAPDGKAAYVTLEALGQLVRIDPAARTVGATLALGPTPRGIAVSHDGKRILVTRHLSAMAGPGAKDHGEVWEVDGGGFSLVRTFRLAADESPDGATTGRGVPNGLAAITISPDGSYALVPATKANTLKGKALDGTVPDFQTTVRSLVMRLDLEANAEDLGARKDVDNRSIPSSVTFDSQGRYAFVTTEGTHKTPILLAHSLGDYSAVVPPDNAADSLAQGHAREMAPIGSALDAGDSLLFVHYFLSREVGVYALGGASGSPRRVALIPTASREPLPAQVLFGKRVFYNAADLRMSKDGYLSCVACHIDGGNDGRVWDFTHKGEGLRRTTDLRGRLAGGGPLHWSANFDEVQDFEHDIRSAFGGDGFLDEARFQAGTRSRTLGDRKAGQSPELDALAAYVASLSAVPPSPFRGPGGAMTEAGKRGRSLFEREDVGCAKCHAAPLFTDSRPAGGAPGILSIYAGARSRRTAEGFLLHDVGTFGPLSGMRMADSLLGLDTPTLKGVWLGGPYLHDGSAPKLRDVIETANRGDGHGKTSHLGDRDKEDLIAYLLQLDDLDEAGQAAVRPAPGTRRGEALRISASMAGGRIRIRYGFPAAGTGNEVRLLDPRGTALAVHRVPAGVREGVWIWDGKGAKSLGAGVYILRAAMRGGGARSVAFVLHPGPSR